MGISLGAGVEKVSRRPTDSCQLDRLLVGTCQGSFLTFLGVHFEVVVGQSRHSRGSKVLAGISPRV